MKVSIKSKFSIIIIFTSILSLIFAYLISSEIIYRNLEQENIAKIEEKINYIQYELYEFKENFRRETEMMSKNIDLIRLLNKADIGYNVKKGEYNNLYNYYNALTSNYRGFDIAIYSSRGDRIFNKGFKENEKIDFTEEGIKYKKLGNEIYIYSIIPINMNKYMGTIVYRYKISEKEIERYKNIFVTEVILLEKNKILKGTLGNDIVLQFRKDNYLEIGEKIYFYKMIDIENIDDLNWLFLFDVTKLFTDIQKITSYLFIAMFLVFSLIFLISTTMLNIVVDSIKELINKINSLKEGNLDINLGKLKASGDEIGILARDFEAMTITLRDKINELEEANNNNKHYSQRLELMNKEMKETQKKMQEKNENIDRINKLLNSRISEITNIYYLIINISKYIIDDNFYEIVIKGIREGLILRKVAIYIVKEESKTIVLTKSLGIGEAPKVLDIWDYIDYMKKRDILQANDIIDLSYYKEFKEPYILPLFSEKSESKDLYGVLLIDNGDKLEQETKKSLITYVKTILLALENRKLYLKLIKENQKLEEATKELQKSEKTKNVFMANVSHELKIPLVPIKGYTELLLAGKIGKLTIKQRKALKTSLNNIERLQEIIENIISYSRIESGKYELLNTKLYLTDVIEEVLMRLENVIEEDRVIIRKNYKVEEPVIYGDQEAIKQIFVNLISNSLKFSKKDRLIIDITISEEEKKYKISLKDNGMGMAKDKVKEILKSFRQLEEGNTRKYRGLGLGLTVVDKILSTYNEKINIISEINNGTEVYFYFKKYTEE